MLRTRAQALAGAGGSSTTLHVIFISLPARALRSHEVDHDRGPAAEQIRAVVAAALAVAAAVLVGHKGLRKK